VPAIVFGYAPHQVFTILPLWLFLGQCRLSSGTYQQKHPPGQRRFGIFIFFSEPINVQLNAVFIEDLGVAFHRKTIVNAPAQVLGKMTVEMWRLITVFPHRR